MKKNISINISGIIFHIEEDGYDRLKSYLDGITTYFSNFEDSSEIIADIESRIAELFLATLNEEKQVISAEDVEKLVSTMGSIQDFEAIEDHEEEDLFGAKEEPKKFQRDQKRKILGGVAAGIAHYFKIDALWIRLLLVAFTLLTVSFGWVVVLTYIVCWIVIPASNELEVSEKVKKMFRDPENRVLGGVAGGLGAYFGIDPIIVRVIFVISIFFGAGILIYIILWIITPEAKTITNKMQMQGQPVTLSNIEYNIKNSLQQNEKEESLLVKIILFPFRLIASILSGVDKVFKPLLHFIVDAFRIIAGIVLVIISFVFILALGTIGGVYAGMFSDHMISHEIPLELMHQSIMPITVIASFLIVGIPILLLFLAGLTILIRKKVLIKPIIWPAFGVWMISLVIIAVTLPGLITDFRTQSYVKESKNFNIDAKSLHLGINEIEGNEHYRVASLRILGHEDSVVTLEKKFIARGNTKANAKKHARLIQYNVIQKDSILVFDDNIHFSKDAKFRAQELEMKLYIPNYQIFTIDYELRDILNYSLYSNGYSVSQLDGNKWMFTENGLNCVTCKKSDEPRHITIKGNQQKIIPKPFHGIDVGGAFEVEIMQGEPKVILVGKPDKLKNVEVRVEDEELNISYKRHPNWFLNFLEHGNRFDDIKIVISNPSIEYLKSHGASQLLMNHFKQDEMQLYISGASKAILDLEVDELEVSLSGASKAKLSGNGRQLEVDASGASMLESLDYEADHVYVETSGASVAKVCARQELSVDASGASSVRYKGRANLDIDKSHASSVERHD